MDAVRWIIVAVLIDAAAVCAWIFLISRFDKKRKLKNQTRLLVYFYLMGMVSFFVSAITYYPLSWIVNPLYGGRWEVNFFFYHLLVVGPGEELIKFAAFALLATKLGTIKELKDGILQACSSALGFAAVENFQYGWNYGLETLIARFYYAAVTHVLLAVIWGAVFSVVYLNMKGEPKKKRVGYVLMGLVPAALFHGLNNFFLEVGSFKAVTYLKVLLGLLGLSIFLYLRKHNPYRDLPLSKYREAMPHLETALKRNPGDFELNYRAGKYTLYGKQYRKSSGHLKVCKRQKPKNPSVNLLYGAALLGAGERHDGRKVLSKRFQALSEHQQKLIRKKLQSYRLPSEVEERVYSAIGIGEAEQGYRIEKVHRPRYMNRNRKPYKQVLDEKTEELRTLLAN